MPMKGFTRNIKSFQILADAQIEAIHEGTLTVLEKTGLRIEHDKALKLFEKNNCKVDYHNMRVRIPREVVAECLQSCPSSFRVGARNPENNLAIDENTTYVCTFPGMQTVDLDTWEPRTPTRKDFYDGVKVLDALDNLHYMGNYIPYFGFEDCPPVMGIPEGFAARVRNSTKVLRMGHNQDSDIFTIKIAQAVGMGAMTSCMASAPLTYYSDAIEALYRAIEAGFPVSVMSGGMMGGSAPATIAGSRLTDNAELIGGLIMAQLIKPGAEVQLEHFVFPLNMRSGMPAFGAIECSIHIAMFCQYMVKLGIRSACANVGSVSSKRIDFQSGYERAIPAVIAALSGCNSIHLFGAIFGERTFHPVQAILDDDVSGMIGRFLEGAEINDETLALDLIDEVGPIPGYYLDKVHTRKWWKKEHFMPKVADRLSLPEWAQNEKKSAIDYARQKMEEILATHKPVPLTPKQEEDVERILEEARQYYHKKELISDEEMVKYRKSMKSSGYPYE